MVFHGYDRFCVYNNNKKEHTNKKIEREICIWGEWIGRLQEKWTGLSKMQHVLFTSPVWDVWGKKVIMKGKYELIDVAHIFYVRVFKVKNNNNCKWLCCNQLYACERKRPPIVKPLICKVCVRGSTPLIVKSLVCKELVRESALPLWSPSIAKKWEEVPSHCEAPHLQRACERKHPPICTAWL